MLTQSGAEAASVQVNPITIERDHASRDGMVRVYLSSLGSPQQLDLTLKGSYTLNNGEATYHSGSKLSLKFNASTGQMTLTVNGVTRNMGTFFTLRRAAQSGGLTIAQAKNSTNLYPGDFSFHSVSKSGGGYQLYPIAHIYIEDYLQGVLPYEMGNSAPAQALQAQAIAARTYTVRMMENRSSKDYDVTDTSSDQLYRGTSSGNANCNSAIEATRGIVLKYGNKYAETYFASSNGGQTESAKNIWGSNGYDYLTVKDDPFDLSSSAKTVSKIIYKDLAHGNNASALLSLLKNKAVSALKNQGYSATSSNTSLQWLESITLHTPKYKSPSTLYTKADFALTVQTQGAGGQSVTVSVTVTCDVFGELESMLGMSLQSSSNELWRVEDKQSSFILRAGRYGHGVGMSQNGAMQMAREGYSHEQILGFYYPGCKGVTMNFVGGILGDAGTSMPAPPQESQPDADFPAQTPDQPMEIIGYMTVLASRYINLRQAPSMSAPVLTTAPEGEDLTVLSLENDWAYVEYNGIRAYAVRSLLSALRSAASGLPPAEETPLPDQETVTATVAIPSGSGTVNFRESPSLNGRVMMQIRHGNQVEVIEKAEPFSTVSYQGIRGYIMTSFLQFDQWSQQPPQQLPEEELPSEDQFVTAMVLTPGGSLNLRQSPSLSARVLVQIPQYAVVEAAFDSTQWSRVRYNGFSGYVMSTYLTAHSQPDTAPPDIPEIPSTPDTVRMATVTTTSGSLNLRMSPTVGSAIIRTIPRSAQVEVYSQGSDWSMVSYRNTAGYVMSKYLTFRDQNADSWQDVPSTEVVNPPVQPPFGQVLQESLAWFSAPYTNIYLSATKESEVLLTVPSGEVCWVIALDDEWALVEYNDFTGYVERESIHPDDDSLNG